MSESSRDWLGTVADAYDTFEAARIGRLSRVRLAALRMDGNGAPFIVMHRKVLYPKHDFHAWLQRRASPLRRSTADTASR